MCDLESYKFGCTQEGNAVVDQLRAQPQKTLLQAMRRVWYLRAQSGGVHSSHSEVQFDLEALLRTLYVGMYCVCVWSQDTCRFSLRGGKKLSVLQPSLIVSKKVGIAQATHII